jgi:predicted phosphodiesterase
VSGDSDVEVFALPPTPDPVRLLVVSDIHMHSGKPSSADSTIPSFASAQAKPRDWKIDALTGIHRLVEADPTIRADLVVCPGDLADRADPAALPRVWDSLHEIAELVEAQAVLAVPGNHDLDSRLQSEIDPKDLLQGLDPGFPIDKQSAQDRFWSRHYLILANDDVTVVLLNSAALHGIADHHEHGFLKPSTLQALIDDLDRAPRTPVNLFITHHHLSRHPDPVFEDYSDMRNAGGLLRYLDAVSDRDWLVIHGHMHQPALSYANGAAGSPVVFGAGSLSRKLGDAYQRSVTNQLYLLELSPSHLSASGRGHYGTYRSWSWVQETGWEPAPDSSHLPSRGGFGERESTSRLAQQVAALLGVDDPFYNWPELQQACPTLRFLLPDDIARLRRMLQAEGLKVLPDNARFVIDQVSLPS